MRFKLGLGTFAKITGGVEFKESCAVMLDTQFWMTGGGGGIETIDFVYKDCDGSLTWYLGENCFGGVALLTS